ncbi:MAG TPA: triose-phosphate isomerase [Gemmatimonadaceae bacterium]|nr:triose-phosphate isomerase [Gemmatimonadaceae bacterium]
MRKPVLAANWKMNHGPSDARAFMRTFLARYARRGDRSVIIFPPAATLSALVDATKERQDILLGVQNIHWEDKGAFTGEISAPIARDAGARFALVGHSERRHVFGEKDDETRRKCAAAARAGLRPMLCVGEKLEERRAGETDTVVLRQLRAGVSDLDPAHMAQMLVAYEPVWAIGTGQTAEPRDASAVHAVIRTALEQLAGDRAKEIPILYGGSVNAGNAQALLSSPGVDGLLVGGASLDAEGWATIARS